MGSSIQRVMRGMSSGSSFLAGSTQGGTASKIAGKTGSLLGPSYGEIVSGNKIPSVLNSMPTMNGAGTRANPNNLLLNPIDNMRSGHFTDPALKGALSVNPLNVQTTGSVNRYFR